MLRDVIKTCNIIVTNNEEYENALSVFNNSSVNIIKEKTFSNINESMPTQIIGWDIVKKEFGHKHLTSKKIRSNLYWTFNSKEDKKTLISDSDKFIKESIKKYLPSKFIKYDFVLDGSFEVFINENIDKKQISFVYFNNNACYIYNNNKTVAISLESMSFCGEDPLFIITGFLNSINCVSFSYENNKNHIYENELKDILTIENIYWSKYVHHITISEIFNFLSELDCDKHRYIPFIMYKLYSEGMSKEEEKSSYRQYKKDLITDWLSSRAIFFDNDAELKSIKLKNHKGFRYTKTKYSNKRTLTGRINSVEGFNPINLSKDNDIRKHIISRYKGGLIVKFDYVSFETMLSLHFSADDEFKEKYKNSDLHAETSKIIFNKCEISENDRDVGKLVNHALLYGGGKRVLKEILPDHIDEDEVIKKVRDFLSPILENSDYINNIVYKEFGYLINNFGTIIRPTKKYAAYNNYIQSTAADIMVKKLFEIRSFLESKKSQFMFQVHDAFVFEIHPSEKCIIKEINALLSSYNKVPFKVGCKIGCNYAECE